MWNPFNKIKRDENGQPKLNFLQRMAMKKFESMQPEEQEKMIQDVLKPENRDKLIKSMKEMEKSGMISKSQFRKAKERMGIYE
jgi:hypothetical protein